MTKKTVEAITFKVKMECLNFGVVAICNSTKLAHHSAKKRGGDIRSCTADHSCHYTKCHKDILNKIVAMKVARKVCARQEVDYIVEKQAQTI